ncbi:DUF1206 domain-containing protein [Phenylobacterium sp.]|uniref:DUF1206 domain-containing protein n=1 Tax=Phenylobacterium sp. TaxID=1871053 RepID=UPI002FE1B513
MSLALPSRSPVLDRLRRRFARWPWATLAEMAARAGYAARGAVYLSIGAIGLMAAADLTPHAEGALGALEAWGEWPPGVALLWLTGLGLYGFAGWRALQALFDPDGLGRSPKALACRAGQAVSGAVHAGLAISVFGLLDAIEDLHEADDRESTRAAVGKALELPAGELLVMAVGLFIVGVAAGNILRAVFDHFGRGLKGDAGTRRLAGWLGRLGYLARGLAFLPGGVFLVLAGWRARTAEVRGLGATLDALENQPLGNPALALLALGLMAFGGFALMEAWRRPIRTERAIRG